MLIFLDYDGFVDLSSSDTKVSVLIFSVDFSETTTVDFFFDFFGFATTENVIDINNKKQRNLDIFCIVYIYVISGINIVNITK